MSKFSKTLITSILFFLNIMPFNSTLANVSSKGNSTVTNDVVTTCKDTKVSSDVDPTVTNDMVSTCKDTTDMPIIKITNLEQVGMVVPNLNQAMANMWKNFGIGPWKVLMFTPDRLSDVVYYDKPSFSGMKISFCQVGNIQLELIEPIGDDNADSDFINKYGNGVQHLGWYKTSSEQDYFATIVKLEAAGFPCIFRGRNQYAYFAYFDTTKVLNTILEVVYINDPAFKPDYIYPPDMVD